MSALATALAQFRTEFAGNLRLRFGVWLILAIVLLYTILLQNERLQGAHAAYATEAARQQRTTAMLARDDWPQLLQAERENYRQFENLMWQAESEGLAQAQLQRELMKMSQDAGLDEVRVHSGTIESVPDVPGVWRVQANVLGDYRAGAELRMLHAVATHPRKLLVDRLEITQSNRRLTLLLSAYFTGFALEQPPDER